MCDSLAKIPLQDGHGPSCRNKRGELRAFPHSLGRLAAVRRPKLIDGFRPLVKVQVTQFDARKLSLMCEWARLAQAAIAEQGSGLKESLSVPMVRRGKAVLSNLLKPSMHLPRFRKTISSPVFVWHMLWLL